MKPTNTELRPENMETRPTLQQIADVRDQMVTTAIIGLAIAVGTGFLLWLLLNSDRVFLLQGNSQYERLSQLLLARSKHPELGVDSYILVASVAMAVMVTIATAIAVAVLADKVCARAYDTLVKQREVSAGIAVSLSFFAAVAGWLVTLQYWPYRLAPSALSAEEQLPVCSWGTVNFCIFLTGVAVATIVFVLVTAINAASLHSWFSEHLEDDQSAYYRDQRRPDKPLT